MRRVLHAADVHLDSPLRKLTHYEHAPVQRIRGASRRAFAEMVTLAIREEVDLVVIAGDLYDGDWDDHNTGLYFVGEAAKLTTAGIPLVVIRGNHDAANVMTSSLPLPQNPDGTDILLDAHRVETRTFEKIGISVHGQSFATEAVTDNLSLAYPPPRSGTANLGLLHTSLTGAENHDRYCPTTPNILTDKGYDYWALGHIHTRADHGLDGGPPLVFPGNLQGRSVRECGPRGCVIVHIDDANRCRHRFEPLGDIEWHRLELDASDWSHPEDLFDAYRAEIRGRESELRGKLWITRVEVTGQTELHSTLHRRFRELEAGLQAIAVTSGGGDVWMEDLRLKTSLPRSSARDAAIDVAEGPLAVLHEVVQQVRADEHLDPRLKEEMKPLQKKLPPELIAQDGPLPSDDDPQWREVIEAASASLLHRIAAGDPDHSEDGS